MLRFRRITSQIVHNRTLRSTYAKHTKLAVRHLAVDQTNSERGPCTSFNRGCPDVCAADLGDPQRGLVYAKKGMRGMS